MWWKIDNALWANGRRQNSHPKYSAEERCENFSNISNSYTNYPHGEMVRLMRALPFANPFHYIAGKYVPKSDALRFPCSVYV